MKTYEEYFADFVDNARTRTEVQGLILAGSRARELESDDSDTDVYVIIDDSMSQHDVERLRREMIQSYGNQLSLDLSYHAIQTVSGFKEYAFYGTEFMWDRYSLVNTQLEFDNTDGRVTEALQAKQRLTDTEQDIGMERYFTAYLNKAYRSMVCAQREQPLGAQLNAVTSIDFLLGSLFTLHHRVPPYYKYLRWELEHAPMTAINTVELIEALQDIAGSGSAFGQKKLFLLLVDLAIDQGYEHYLKQWGTKLDRIRDRVRPSKT